jgi:hypothetical protein
VINAGLLDIPGLTRLTIDSDTNITVGPLGIQLPEGVILELRAGTIAINGPIGTPGEDVVLVADDEISLPGPEVIPSPIFYCPGLRFENFGTVSIEDFEIEAALEVEVGVQILHGRHGRKRVHPLHTWQVKLAVLGSESLDVRDIVPSSLRVGANGLAPSRHKRRLSVRRDINHDGYPDLVARFSPRRSGLTPSDTEVCLIGETAAGPAIRGCVEIPSYEKKGPRGRRHRHRRGHRH